MKKSIVLFVAFLSTVNNVTAATTQDCEIIEITEKEVVNYPDFGYGTRKVTYISKYTLYMNSGIYTTEPLRRDHHQKKYQKLDKSEKVIRIHSLRNLTFPDFYKKGRCLTRGTYQNQIIISDLITSVKNAIDKNTKNVTALTERIAAVQTQQANLLMINLNMIASRMKKEGVQEDYSDQLKTLKKMICLMAPNNVKDKECE